MATSSLPTEMKAQFLDSFNTPYVLRSVPLPKLTAPNDVLIKVDAASYCHTDAVLAAGQMPPNPPSFPHIGCHEFAGTVVSVHPESKSSLKTGDRVGVPGRSFHACGTCFECERTEGFPDVDEKGFSMYCPKSRSNGISKDGGFAEYQVVDVLQCAVLPENMSAVQAATLMCAGVTIFNALKKCSLKPGDRVGIVGCGGGLGHLGLQFATKMGYKTIGIDNADAPMAIAKGLNTGAELVDVREVTADDLAQRMGAEDRETQRGHMGVDAVIILPESQKAFDYGIQMLRNHGKCVVVSFPAAGFHFSCQDIVFRDIQIIGSLVGTVRTLRETVDFAAKHDIRAVIQTYPLAKLNELVQKYHEGGGGKLVVDMTL